MRCDLLVVGGGTAGVAAALEAARLGADVTLVDPFDLDAASSRAGAIPLAVLRDATLRMNGAAPRLASLLDLAGIAKQRGIDQWRRSFRQLQRARVRILRGVARLGKATSVDLDSGESIEASTIVLATGSRPRRPSDFPFDDDLVCDCQSVLRLGRPVRSVVVLGAEEEGCEFASVLAALGAQTTLIERRRKLFRMGDRDVLSHLHDGLRAAGIAVVNEDVLERVEVIAGGGERYVRLTLSSGRTEVSDLLLVVAGRVANPPTIAEGVELATDVRGFIVVDEAFRTSLPGVYAIGDATGPPFRLGTALYQARAAVCDALSGAFSPVAELPMSVHTIPQIATVGLGEDAARMLGMRTVVGTACEEDLVVRGMSHDPIRLLKLTFDGQTGQLMGVQIAGGAAAELIHLGAQFIAQGAHAQHIASAIFSHPSQADAFRVAATAALDWSAFAREQLQGEGATP